MDQDMETFKRRFAAVMEDEAFRSIVDKHVEAAVKMAVDKAVAVKDAEIKELREELTETKTRLNELEQYSRRMCLNVSGIPEASNESTDQLVADIAKMAGVAIAPGDIDRTHRIGMKRQGQHRTIIARITTFAKRQELYDARKKLRTPKAFPGSTVTAATAQGAFISDNLTRENQLILYKARQLKRERKLYAAWSDVGKLKVRVREGGPTVIIRSDRDLAKLMGSPASGSEAAATAADVDSDGFRRVTRHMTAGKN